MMNKITASVSALTVPTGLPTVTTTVTPPGSPPPDGTHAILAAAVAIFGVVTALFPGVPLVAAVTSAIPQLKIALPIVLTSVGSIWAAVAHPPAFLKGGNG